MGLLPWSPLGGGWLSGKYRRDQRPTGATRLGEDPGRGMEAYDRRGTDRTWRVIDAVDEVAESRGISMAGGRARLGHRPSVGDLDDPRRPDDRAAGTNLGAAGLELSDERRRRDPRRGERPLRQRLPVRRAGYRERCREIAGG